MKGDFSRLTFDAAAGFTRVLLQQGRVLLDSDWNEQNSIITSLLRRTIVDFLGFHIGPIGSSGFEVVDVKPKSIRIAEGPYYVGGLRCDNRDSKHRIPVPAEMADLGSFLVYLEAWEQHVTYIQNDRMREVALGGPDTATRTRVRWRIGFVGTAGTFAVFEDPVELRALILESDARHTPRLIARARKPAGDHEPCKVAPDAMYRGLENQLYRLEVHDSGRVEVDGESQATFKWSRDNGSVTFPVRSVEEALVELETLGDDELPALAVGDWVEVGNDDSLSLAEPGPLLRILSLDVDSSTVTLSAEPATPRPGGGSDSFDDAPGKHPFLRRWDQRGEQVSATGGVPVPGHGNPVHLENGVEILFPDPSEKDWYRAGDYWLVPARVNTGDVEWPDDPDGVEPHGVVRAFAPLAFLKQGDPPKSLRRVMKDPTL